MPRPTPPKPGEFVERDLDWTARQQGLASDPDRSAWVSANAGSGKTHVLSQRVIRLLLAGCRPSAILCLTYTKAAASEMANRVFERLAEWTVLSDAELTERISGLEARKPDAADLAFARQLFARALETPGGLKIQTIHAFCEAVLHQFPLEANVAGHFDVMDEADSARLLTEAREALLSEVASGADDDLADAFHTVLDMGGEWGLEELFAELVRQRRPVRDFIAAVQRFGGPDPVLRKALGLGADETEDRIIAKAWPLPSLSASDISVYGAAAANRKAQTPKTMAAALADIASLKEDEERFDRLTALFLKQDGQPRSFSKAASKDVRAVFPEIEDKLNAAAFHLQALIDRRRTLRLVDATCAALVLGVRLDREYESLKRRGGRLDFEDLVSRTAILLEREGAGPWVHYKLDQGIDHILVDEAQDTSPEQWAVITRLAEEFFAGKGARADNRTLFAVGDEKQSIYSFQGARPELFLATGRDIAQRAMAAEKRFDPLNLYLSFRSTGDVLTAVDAVFSDAENSKGLTSLEGGVTHASFRSRDPGSVDIWEMIAKDAADDEDDWKAPFDATPESAPPALLAARVAATIRDWLAKGETLTRDAAPRPLSAGDILVLVRKRDGFVAALMRALKRNGIAVAGADRLKLVEHIAVEDLMALGRVMLNPGDDLSVCAVLKSPLFDFSEEDIFELAAQREEGQDVHARLSELAAARGGRFADAARRFAELLSRADRMPVFDFYARLLGRDGGRAKFLARLGHEASDVLDEFLNFALEQETAALPGLQAFLTTLESRSPEIKRELEQGRDEVRIMTVHASKGLEAPIVFLVDSGGKPADSRHVPKLRALPLEKTVGPLPPAPLWVSGKSTASNAAETLKGSIIEAAQDEYRRLLYVGMTRAADRLIICGYHGLRQPAYRHWHRMAAEALGARSEAVETTYRAAGQEWGGVRFSISDGAITGTATPPAEESGEHEPLPAGLGRPLPATARLPRPLAPSAAGVIVDGDARSGVAASPISGATPPAARPMERGRLIHRLLQLLPAVPPDQRAAATGRYLRRAVPDWPEDERGAMGASVLKILTDERFSGCFAPDSRAEVAVMGTLEVAGRERAVSARLDRIAVTPEKVLIVDYKTNRQPATRLEDVPPVYVLQMALYRALVQPLYPDRPVELALLFTEGPVLLPLPDDMLEAALAGLERESPQI